MKNKIYVELKLNELPQDLKQKIKGFKIGGYKQEQVMVDFGEVELILDIDEIGLSANNIRTILTEEVF